MFSSVLLKLRHHHSECLKKHESHASTVTFSSIQTSKRWTENPYTFSGKHLSNQVLVLALRLGVHRSTPYKYWSNEWRSLQELILPCFGVPSISVMFNQKHSQPNFKMFNFPSCLLNTTLFSLSYIHTLRTDPPMSPVLVFSVKSPLPYMSAMAVPLPM